MKNPHRLLRLPLLAAVLSLLAPALHAATHTLNYAVEHDSWVVNGDTTPNGTTATLSVSSPATNPKYAFIRFRVKMSGLPGSTFAGRAITGTPNQAILRLRQNSTGPVQPIYIVAAHNRTAANSAMWDETAVTWTNKPTDTTFGPATIGGTPLTFGAIVSKNSLAAAGPIDFDVTDYISGPGDYTFCVRVDTANQVDFSAKEGANPPQLILTIKDDLTFAHNANRNPYYIRYASEVHRRGNRYRHRAEAVAVGEINNIGILKATQQPYGAWSNNTESNATENTLSIQRAINEARDMRLPLYFSGGTYYVNDTLQAVQGEIVHGDSAHSFPYEYVDGLRATVRDFPCVLLGDPAAQAILKIATGAGRFSDDALPNPLVYFWSRQNSEDAAGNPTPELNEDNSQYHAGFHNIDLDLNANPGAIGLSIASAQGCTVSNVDITGKVGTDDFYAGFDGAPGPGGYMYGITVTGGQFGGLFADGHAPLIINSKFTGQSSQSLLYADRGSLALVGVEISGRGILQASSGGAPWLANLNLVDSRIEITANNLTAISGDRSVFVKNSYLKNGTGPVITVTDPSGGLVENEGVSAVWKVFPEWATGVTIEQSPNFGGANIDRVPIWEDGAQIGGGAHAYKPIAPSAATPPADFSQGAANFHAWPADFDKFRYVQNDTTVGSTTVINAKTTTTYAGPLGGIDTTATDNAARLNAIIDNAPVGAVIFIPAGEFQINGTISLDRNVTLYGVSASHSVLRALPALGAKPMVSTLNSGAATPKLADLMLLLPNNTNAGAYFTLWQAGAGSAVKNVIFDRHLAETGNVDSNVPAIQIANNGGGRWYGVWNESGANQNATNYRHVRVLNTNQDLRFYMFNVEHALSSPQAEFDNADNFRIYQSKAESAKTGNRETLSFRNAGNFRVFGLAGSASPDAGQTNIRVLAGCTTYLFSHIQLQQQGAENPFNFMRLIDNGADKVLGEEQAVLYKRGITTATAR